MLRIINIFMLLMCALPALSQSKEALVVAFTGDVLLDRGVRTRIEADGIDALFSHKVDSLFKEVDYVVGNLECPATENIHPIRKKYMFRAEPDWLDALQKHGFTHLNLANNHSVDQGRKGLVATINNVRKAGMMPFGAGKNREEASQPLLIAKSPRKVFIIASEQMMLENYPWRPDKPMPASLSVEDICLQIQFLKQQHLGCCVIVCLHWGVEHTTEPTFLQRHDAEQIIKAGADAMVCHHTHTLQSTEIINGAPVFYSIGNFIFDPINDVNRTSAIVVLKITAEGLDFYQHPVKIINCTPYIE